MSIWEELEVGRKVCEALADVTPNDDPGHHLGQPFVTAYQLAIKLDRTHPEVATALGVTIGGTGTGSQSSLAQYLAREVSQRINHGEDFPVDGAFLSNDEIAGFAFAAPAGQTITSSFTGSVYPMRATPSTFGMSDEKWEQAKSELKAAIVDAARARQMTWYGQVAAKVNAVHVEPYSALMNHLLGAILEDEHTAERPLLTAIVTHKDGDKEPGPGFYEMARTLGYSVPEPYIFWAMQVQDIFKRYGQPKSYGRNRAG